MKKSLLIFLLVAMLIISFALVACNDKEEGDDKENQTQNNVEHNVDKSKWMCNDTHHWYDCSCGQKHNNAEHADTDKNGVCDQDGCGFVTCSHEYATEYSQDEINHWYALTCGCVVEPQKSAHEDTNKDGLCDVCERELCTHTFADEWSSDETGHWYAFTCECTGAAVDKKAHTGFEDGICDTCNYGDHEHTWGDYAVVDRNTHKRETTCEGHAPVIDTGNHADAEKDGICDICLLQYCQHTYSEEIKYDENNHFYPATCGCNIPGKDMAPHTGVEENGKCDECNYVEHTEHTLSDWKSDETHHWKERTCECAPGQYELALHTGKQDDGECDVCGHGAHEHVYADTWLYDTNSHWQNSNCEFPAHDPLKGKESPHIDNNNDKKCDVCKWDYGHTHTYSTDWDKDAKAHWHKPTCGCNPDIVRSEYGVHDGNGEGFACSVCGEPSFKVNVDAAVSGKDNVSNGSVTIEDIKSYGTSVKNIEFAFGNKYTYISSVFDEEETEIYWHHILKNSSYFSLRKFIYQGNDNGISKYTDATANHLNGYAFDLSFIDSNLSLVYGSEELIAQIFNYAVTDDAVNGDINATSDGNKHTFSFECIEGAGDFGKLMQVVVTFELDENNTVINATVDATTYADPTASKEEAAIEDKDYYFYIDDEGKKKAEILEGAVADSQYKMTITQTAGERNATSPYNLDEILVNDFSITDTSGNAVTDETQFEMGGDVVLNFNLISPDTANLNYDAVSFEILADNGASYVTPIFDVETNQITLRPNKAGMWQLTVRTALIERKVQFEVTTPATTALSVEVGGMPATEKHIYVGSGVTFEVKAQNQYADRRYDAVCDNENGVLTKDETSGACTFTANVAGTYVITVTSKANPSVSTTFTVYVNEKPEMILSGKYHGEYTSAQTGTWSFDAIFVPQEGNASQGIVTVKYSQIVGDDEVSGKTVYNFTHDETITLELTDGTDIGFEFYYNDNFKLSAVEKNTDKSNGVELAFVREGIVYTATSFTTQGMWDFAVEITPSENDINAGDIIFNYHWGYTDTFDQSNSINEYGIAKYTYTFDATDTMVLTFVEASILDMDGNVIGEGRDIGFEVWRENDKYYIVQIGMDRDRNGEELKAPLPEGVINLIGPWVCDLDGDGNVDYYILINEDNATGYIQNLSASGTNNFSFTVENGVLTFSEVKRTYGRVWMLEDGYVANVTNDSIALTLKDGTQLNFTPQSLM